MRFDHDKVMNLFTKVFKEPLFLKSPLLGLRIFAFVMTFAFGSVLSATPIPFSGKISVNGANFDGAAQFTFALRDANGTVHWRNGADANASIEVPVDRGHYIVLLGGQEMTSIGEELPRPSRAFPSSTILQSRYPTMAPPAARPAHHLDSPRPNRRAGQKRPSRSIGRERQGRGRHARHALSPSACGAKRYHHSFAPFGRHPSGSQRHPVRRSRQSG